MSTTGQTTVAAALQRSLATDPGRPFVTFYDDATAERTELSALTFDNWVAKTANLLQDDLEVEPGGRVALWLPLHWQTAVWLAATWALGAVVTGGSGPEHSDVVVASSDRLDEAAAGGIARVVGVSLRPLGGRLEELPPGVVDYAADVLGHGDRFVPPMPVEPQAMALELKGRTASQRELLADADSAAAALPESTGMRLLTAASPNTYEGVRALLLLPLVTTGSVVICRNLDPDALAGRIATERVTATIGVTADVGVPRLG